MTLRLKRSISRHKLQQQHTVQGVQRGFGPMRACQSSQADFTVVETGLVQYAKIKLDPQLAC